MLLQFTTTSILDYAYQKMLNIYLFVKGDQSIDGTTKVW